MLSKLWAYYNTNYKKVVIIPIILILFFSSILVWNKIKTGEFVEKDISLKGGTTITVNTEKSVAISDLERSVSAEFDIDDIAIRELSDPLSRKTIGYEIQLGTEVERSVLLSGLESILNIELDDQNTSIGYQGSSLAKTFFRDITWILLISFILVSIVSLYYFKNVVSSCVIILSVVGDIICVLGLMNILGIKFSIATIGALLMIIGYSTDSNILMTTNIVKRTETSVENRIKRTIKTEFTMDAAAYTTYSVMFFLSNIAIIQHIALVLILGIFFDEIFTSGMNNTLQRMRIEKK